jgi:hypothetical protein
VTFVVAFAPGVNAERIVGVTRLLLVPVAVLLAYTLAVGAQRPLGPLLLLHLAGLTVAGLMCHARLAADRPPPSRLTEFYLWVAAGGVLGGIVNALVAPLLLPALIEYPAAILAACALRPAAPRKRPDILEFFLRDPRPTKAMDVLVPVLLGSALLIAIQLARPDSGGELSFTAQTAIVGLACGLAFNLQRRPLRFALGLGAVILAANLAVAPGEDTLVRDRSFFGIYKVVTTGDGRYHELYDGTTVHGMQRVGDAEPLEYYARAGPVGQALDGLPPATTERVGVVGLGAGAMACYRPGATTFYEIDPTVVRIARDEELFTYLRDCPAQIVLGDGRQSIEREPPGRVGLLALDAFNSDAIPVHLMTREAIELYLSRVGPRGAVLFHISNRYLRLEPVLAATAADLGAVCRAQAHRPTAAEADQGVSPSRWAVLARTTGDLGNVATDGRWGECQADGTRAWTDDYSDLLGALELG